MNKRQAKKKYKKEHGHNPPSKRGLAKVQQAVTMFTPEQAAALAAGITRAAQLACRAIADAADAISYGFRGLAETYRDRADELERGTK